MAYDNRKAEKNRTILNCLFYTMTEKKKCFQLTEKHIPILLLLVTIAAYIPLISQLGFYWDDWPMLWFKITKGAEGFATAFDSDRPFLGYLYQITAHLSNDPLVWQIITVILRWAVTLSFWWMLRQLWPERKHEVFWISLLLAVYPGFKQMPIVYVWLNGFVLLLEYILSYGMMLKAISSGSKKGWILWTVPSIALFTLCTVTTEYYTGLEVCRFFIIWIFLAGNSEFRRLTFMKKVWKVILQWLPYLGVLGIFMFWRVVIFRFPSYQPVLMDQLASKPLYAIFNVIIRIIEDAYTATWAAWVEFFSFPNHVDFETYSGLLFWIAAGLSFILIFLISMKYQPGREQSENDPEHKKSDQIWSLTAIGLGLFMVICPGFPFWVTMLPIHLSYPYDRFLVAFMFGSSIFMVGLIFFFLRTSWQKNLVLALFTAMAVGGNILNANSYRKDWNTQKDFASQLVTRIPLLKESTILLADDNPMIYESDNSLTGMVNLALEPQSTWDDDRLPYSVMFFTPRFGTIEEYKNRSGIYQNFRGSLFGAHNEDVVVYHYSPPGCLRIVDPEQHAGLNIFPDTYKDFLYLSNPAGRIDPYGEGADILFKEVFKQPVEKNWCYYFQKADLARQTEDWETIAEIGDEVLPIMKAGEASEYFIFIEAYMNLDRYPDAMELFKRVHAEDKGLDAVLCPYLIKWIGNHPPEDENVITPLIASMNSVGCALSKN